MYEAYNQYWLNTHEGLLDEPEFMAAHEIVDMDKIHEEAHRLISEHRAEHHIDIEQEPEINAKTALFEALTAAGDLQPINFGDDLDEVHQQILARLLNGYRHNLPDWEKQRRFNEICEELIVNRVRKMIETGQLSVDIVINTISDYPELATRDQAREIGYRYLNQKGFVRTHHFHYDENGRLRRSFEQISRSNSNNGSSQLLLNDHGLSRHYIDSSTGRLGLQFMTTRDQQPDLAIDLMRWLDRRVGMNNLYGENRHIAKRRGRPEYEDLRQVSAQRREQMAYFIDELAQYEAELQVLHKSGVINYDEKLWRYHHKQKRVVERILIMDPDYAYDARGAAAEKHYRAASLAFAMNDETAFYRHHEQAIKNSDPDADVVCGGGGKSSSESEGEGSQSLFKQLQKDKEQWKWRNGICAVKSCPTRPHQTKVGPCSVCERCQAIFDKGDDPTTMGVVIEIRDRKQNAKRTKPASFVIVQSQAA